MIIASGAWIEIYEECIIHGFSPLIFDEESEALVQFKELCERNFFPYSNDMYYLYYHELMKQRDESVEKLKKTGQLFENIVEIAIMLSNLCNYASIHTRCPASLVKHKEIISAKNVYCVLDELSSIDFCGTICFHVYNEPLIDPRLCVFMKYAKERIPRCKIRLYSNGYYLNQTLLDDLVSFGMDALCVTGYGKKEYLRLISLNVEIPYMVLFGNLDERIDYYIDAKEAKLAGVPCRTFITQTTIYPNGDVGLCCLDYKHKYELGNINNSSLRECLNNDRTISVQNRLLKGDRSEFNLCMNCVWDNY